VPAATGVPSISDLRYLYYGGGSDAEYTSLKLLTGMSGTVKGQAHRVAWENDSANVSTNSASESSAHFTYNIPAIVSANYGANANPYGGYKIVINTHGLIINTSGGAATCAFRCKVNGTTSVGTSTVPSFASSASEYYYDVTWTIMPDNDWSLNQKAEFTYGSGVLAPPTSAAQSVMKGYTRGSTIVQATYDSNIALTFTTQLSSASTTSVQMHGYEVLVTPTYPG
jgi:hypothetical protein